MTQEEKAKAYDETRKKIAIRFGSNVADEIFSQFELSKDERIRKELIAFLRYYHFGQGDSQPFNEDWISWLEKQGEQKPVVSLDENGEPILTPFEAELFSMMSDAWQNYSLGEEVNIAKIVKEHSEELLERANEQKPAWSEEDEKYWSIVIAEFSKCAGKSVSKDEWMRCNDWLNSLRDKLQPKQEWSEEDLQILNAAILHVKNATYNYYGGYSSEYIIRWLKSLRPQKQYCNNVPSREYILNVWELGNYWKELTNGVCSTEHGTELEYIQKHWKEGGYYDKISICSQKQWKPSEEQMKALAEALSLAKSCGEESAFDLRTLYENLRN